MIPTFLNWNILLKARTDFENVGEKMSEKYSFLLKIGVSEGFERQSFLDFGIVTILKKVLGSNII